jgi:ABC-2 type transport system ATP-binding protein
MTAIETSGLTKQYGDVTAVDDLDLVVDEGTVFGFLGPNGAGKSTVINCILDYIRPTRGQISVLGDDAQADALAVRQRTGVLPEGFAVYDRLTGRQHLQFMIDSHEASDDPDAIAERVGLGDAIDRRAGGYSKGMAQRLILGTALVGQPELLILDEPSTGLDPEGVHTMREIVREEAARGATVFFSSHILGQVEAVCDRVGILQEGSLVAEDTVEGLRAADGSEAVLTVEVEHVPEGALAAVRGLPGVSDVTASDTTVTVQCGDGAKLPVLNELDASASVQDFDLTKPSLEDLFLAHMEDATPPADTGAAPPPTSRDHSSEVANQ